MVASITRCPNRSNNITLGDIELGRGELRERLAPAAITTNFASRPPRVRCFWKVTKKTLAGIKASTKIQAGPRLRPQRLQSDNQKQRKQKTAPE
jgi:hypothetical protein